jgi:hypothetical protein
LRALLRDRSLAPVLVLGTIWPHTDRWGALTTEPDRGRLDPHEQARKLLAGAEITVPPEIGADRAAADAVAARDPLWRYALREDPDRPIQFMAGARYLLHRYATATPAQQAVLHAAADASRMNGPAHLSLAFLQAATQDYLRNADWQALPADHQSSPTAWVRDALHNPENGLALYGRGVPGPLHPVRTTSDQSPVYELAGYLEQHLRRIRARDRIPDSLWDAFAAALDDLTDLEATDSTIKTLAPCAPTRAPWLADRLIDTYKRLRVLDGGTAAEPSTARHTIAAVDPWLVRVRALVGWKPPTASQVSQTIAPLLGRCAQADPQLLPRVLDVLWAMAARDTRATARYPEHPVLVLKRIIASQGPRTVDVVIKRVNVWLAEPDPPDAVRTPLFALEPLLTKDKFRQERVRAILVREGRGGDPRRAAEAVRILGAGLQQPAVYSQGSITAEEIAVWEERRRAAVVASMREIAEATAEPLVRRLIRREIEWTARYEPSTGAALELVTELDAHTEDDLTEAIVRPWSRLLTSRRGIPLPTHDGGDLEAVGTVGVETDEQTVPNEDAEREAAAIGLWDGRDPEHVIAVLDERLRVIQAADRIDQVNYAFLLTVAGLRLQAVPELVEAAVALDPGPLDNYLAGLLDTWARSDLEGFIAALDGLMTARAGVKRAVAIGFSLGSWSHSTTGLPW